MTPYKQLIRHNPDRGDWGDCGRTAVACLMDRHPSEVPHWFEGAHDQETGSQANDAKRAWLKTQGIQLIRWPLSGEMELEELLIIMEAHNPGVWYTLQGRSRNDVDHVVVCRGGRIEHDPSQDLSGIVGPGEGNIWWVEFLVRDVVGGVGLMEKTA